MKTGRSIDTDVNDSSLLSFTSLSFPVFPLPDDYSTRDDYFSACAEWEKTIQKNIGLTASIPLPLSLSIKVPQPPSQRPASKFDPFRNSGKYPPSPELSLKILRHIISGSREDDELVSRFLRTSKSWGNELFEKEPEPREFGSYEDYLASMHFWLEKMKEKEEYLKHPELIGELLNFTSDNKYSTEDNESTSDKDVTEFYYVHLCSENVLKKEFKFDRKATLTDEVKCGNLLELLYFDAYRNTSCTVNHVKKEKKIPDFIADIKTTKKELISQLEEGNEPIDPDEEFAFWRNVCGFSEIRVVRFNKINMDVDINDFSDIDNILSYNLSSAQFSELISDLSKENSYGLISKLKFYLSQSSIKTNYRLMMNIFLLIKKLIQINRDVLLSQLLADCSIASMTTHLICQYSEKQMFYQNYYPPDENEPNSFLKLLYLVFSEQLIQKLIILFNDNAETVEILKAHQETFLIEQKIILTNYPQEIRNSFKNAESKNSLQLHTSVFILLSLNDIDSFLEAFHTSSQPFYYYISKLKSNVDDNISSYRISSFFLYNPEVTRKYVQSFFNVSYLQSSVPWFTIVIYSIPLLSSMISSEYNNIDLPFSLYQNTLFYFIQFVNIRSDSIIPMIITLSNIIRMKIIDKDKEYIESFEIIKQTILSIFFTSKVDDYFKSKLAVGIVNMLFIRLKNEKDVFLEKFLSLILSMMQSNNFTILNNSWIVFREWVICGYDIIKLIDQSPKMQEELKIALDKMQYSLQAQIQYFLLMQGFSVIVNKVQNKVNYKLLFGNDEFYKIMTKNEKSISNKIKHLYRINKIPLLNWERKALSLIFN